ncbi:hypothetical protein CYLTODRAFT_440945 [Cylindrobasidium torrendii FP15055 ss-10]|uniref:Peptide hydrolase n=1 Tax=Cylindrobasidium torrendii FP15055 ss-10 TaxID=1314674 RepID=A0A0D7BN20_9AGAR|nr:hypothetical protein CYLTODRAFT_440945 [Cylindrobasidium torrendii FP15055 ss-10]
MSLPAVDSYISRQVLINKNIVTYRTLSRNQSLSVHAAKNELAAFYKAARKRQDTLAATYIIIGIPKPVQAKSDVVDDDGYQEDEGEEFPSELSMVVPEDELESVKVQFAQITSIHFYSLSPSAINDCDLLYDPNNVRDIDEQKGREFATIVGKVVGDNIKEIPEKLRRKATLPTPVAGPSKTKAEEKPKAVKKEETIKPTGKKTGVNDFFKPRETAKKEPDAKETKPTLKKGVAAGFFKKTTADPKAEEKAAPRAKAKEDKKSTKSAQEKEPEEAKPIEPKKEETSKVVPTLPKKPSISEKVEAHRAANQKRKASNSDDDAPKPVKESSKKRRSSATSDSDEELVHSKKDSQSLSKKRKSEAPSSDEEDAPPAKKSVLKKKPTISSDEEDDGPVMRRRRPGAKVKKIADYDEDLEAMMNLGDDEVDVASRRGESKMQTASDIDPPDSDVEDRDDDVEMDAASDWGNGQEEEDEPIVKRKRAPKKKWPIGRNGLKKKRLIKTRMTQDKKGYDVTEDYSEYESVDEESQTEPEQPKKGKGKKFDSDEDVDMEKPEHKPKGKGKNKEDTEEKPAKAKKGKKDAGEDEEAPAKKKDTKAKPTKKAATSKMLYLFALVSLVLSAAVQAAPTAEDIASKSAQGLYFLQLDETSDPVWKTQGEKLALLREGTNFMDVTDTYERKLKLAESKKAKAAKANAAFPDGPSHQDAVNDILDTVSIDNMKKYLDGLIAFNNRYYDSDTGAEASTYIRDTVADIIEGKEGVNVSLYKHSKWKQPSIIAKIAGSDADTPVTIIGAHMDSINLDDTSGPAPGADDDGTGTVNLIEALRALLEAGYKPATPVEFHWYAGEEAGLLGSQEIASAYSEDGVDVQAFMEMDMSGYFAPGTKEVFALQADYIDEGLNTFLGTLIDEYAAFGWTMDKPCGYACSDHASWNEAGYPTTFPYEAVTGDDNPNVHSPDDTLEVDGFSWTHVLEFAKIVVAFAYELAPPA